jgi:hypothetical protein
MFLLSPICELFEKLSATNAASASAHDRISEDLRGIVERHSVLVRVATQHKSAQKSLEAVKQKIQDFEEQNPRNDTNPARTEQAIAKLQFAKKEALLRARDATVLLIAERKKFSKFAFRKIREAFGRLGAALVAETDDELPVLAKLLEGLRQARAGQALSDTRLDGIEVYSTPEQATAAASLAPPPRPSSDPETGATNSEPAPAKPEEEPASFEPAPAKPVEEPAPAKPQEEPAPAKSEPAPSSVRASAKTAVLFEDALFDGIAQHEQITAPPEPSCGASQAIFRVRCIRTVISSARFFDVDADGISF